MFARLQRVLALVALASLLGGHWAVLQSVAWTKMLIDRSAERTAIEAIVSTFSGDEPCELCDSIAAGQSDEKRDPFVGALAHKPVVALVAVTRFVPRTPPLIAVLSEPRTALASQRPSPPTPPPRHLA